MYGIDGEAQSHADDLGISASIKKLLELLDLDSSCIVSKAAVDIVRMDLRHTGDSQYW